MTATDVPAEASSTSVDGTPKSLAAPPALFEHCNAVYGEMLRESKLEPYETYDDEVPTYTGFLTKLVAKLRLSVPYYSKVTRALQEMDCIRQVRRGGGGSPSVWLLIQAPTLENFRARVTDSSLNSSQPRKTDQQGQALRDLNERVTRLEQALINGS